MDYSKIKQGLREYPQTEVDIYITYLIKLETEKYFSGVRKGQLKNPWIKFFSENQAISIYKKVALDGLFIDGDTITLQYKGSVNVSYNYQAYKNKLLKIYPESKFDIQNVYKGDGFSFRKESGKVFYTHDINNPFATNKEIIGCYCIIKNDRGEFIETLNKDDINKMRAVAKTQDIWNEWYGEMVLKSVIKRACKRHFKDVVTNIESLDNENYIVENVSVEPTIQEMIEKCDTLEDLQIIYEENTGKVKDEPQFLKMLTNRKHEIQNENSQG